MKRLIKVGRIKLLLIFIHTTMVYSQEVNNAIVPQYGNYSFSYNQVPEQLVSLGTTPAGYAFQWESSVEPTTGFTAISGATLATLSFSAVLSQTSFYRRKATQGATIIYSNLIKLQLVSATWDNYNYVREHKILVPGQTDWKIIDALPIGSKLQVTTYIDGIAREVQTVFREAATSADHSNPSLLWGDIVSFSEYDALGRQQRKYLPYTTNSQPGRYKPTASTAQTSYYSTNHGETSPYSSASFESNPTIQVKNLKNPGTSWAAGAGNSISNELNDATDDVKIFIIGYSSGDIPSITGVYPVNSLFKVKSTDENGNRL